MATITVNIARRGHLVKELDDEGNIKFKNGNAVTKPSDAGHMWITLPNGETRGLQRDPNKVVDTDGKAYGEVYDSFDIEISEEDMRSLQDLVDYPGKYGFEDGSYLLTYNDCIDYVWKALELAGLNPRGSDGDWLPALNIDNIERLVLYQDTYWEVLSDQIHRWFNGARDWTTPRRDPLAIDLDGDGIETIGADGTVVFDHDGDGVKTGTGWVKADDAFVVLDRNGNGLIDTGAELFGVDTVKADGSFAVDGFDALSDLDSNGDGVFDARDSEFANVRLWQDADQDGVSDEGELTSLTDAGIVSINLEAKSGNVNLGNGNVQTGTAAHLTVDGEKGTTGNLDLVFNTFYSEFTDKVTLTEKAKGLPEVRGSGMVRNLREAMSLSSELATVVSSYAAQTGYTDRRALLGNLIETWADTSTLQTSIELALENKAFCGTDQERQCLS